MDDKELLAACGLYCGACYHYRASFPEGVHLINWAKQQGKCIEGFTCGGCRAEKSMISKCCSNCDIRDCADMKGIVHCGECPEFPCDRITGFQNNGYAHHLDVLSNLDEINREGMVKWLKKQKEKWTCRCGAPLSWYEEKCSACSRNVRSYSQIK